MALAWNGCCFPTSGRCEDRHATRTSPGAAALEMIAIHREDWIQAISASIDHVSGLTAGTPPPIGLLGFSLGGHLALQLRAKVQVLVSFFAPMLDGIWATGSLTHAQIHHGACR